MRAESAAGAAKTDRNSHYWKVVSEPADTEGDTMCKEHCELQGKTKYSLSARRTLAAAQRKHLHIRVWLTVLKTTLKQLLSRT